MSRARQATLKSALSGRRAQFELKGWTVPWTAPAKAGGQGGCLSSFLAEVCARTQLIKAAPSSSQKNSSEVIATPDTLAEIYLLAQLSGSRLGCDLMSHFACLGIPLALRFMLGLEFHCG